MNLAKLRREKNITQDQLAKILGVTRSAVSMWEINASNPSIEMLTKLAKVLNCSIDELIKDEEKEK